MPYAIDTHRTQRLAAPLALIVAITLLTACGGAEPAGSGSDAPNPVGKSFHEHIQGATDLAVPGPGPLDNGDCELVDIATEPRTRAITHCADAVGPYSLEDLQLRMR